MSIRWRCVKSDDRFTPCHQYDLGGEPNEFLGYFYCPEHDPRNRWIVAYHRSHVHPAMALTQVHDEQGRRPVKDVQDAIAADQAQAFPDVIYMVVRESDFRNYYADLLHRAWGIGSGAQAS